MFCNFPCFLDVGKAAECHMSLRMIGEIKVCLVSKIDNNIESFPLILRRRKNKCLTTYFVM